MPQLYGRQIKVTVAGLIVDHPRISFEVQRTTDQTQTTGRVKLYNLTDARAKRIQDRGGPIVIEAGYPETIAVVFDGQVERVQRARESHAHVTDIKLGDQVRQKDKLAASRHAAMMGRCLCDKSSWTWQRTSNCPSARSMPFPPTQPKLTGTGRIRAWPGSTQCCVA